MSEKTDRKTIFLNSHISLNQTVLQNVLPYNRQQYPKLIYELSARELETYIYLNYFTLKSKKTGEKLQIRGRGLRIWMYRHLQDPVPLKYLDIDGNFWDELYFNLQVIFSGKSSMSHWTFAMNLQSFRAADHHN